MIVVSQSTRDVIFRSGVALLIVGAALAVWAFQDFEALPNYLRIACLIPVVTAQAMLRIDQYRNWSSVHGLTRGYAVGALIVPPMLLIGSLIWLVVAPSAHG